MQAVKPNSSRSQSAEIFVVCLKYTAPKFIDPKFLDPNHVFKEVEDPGMKKVDVLHKKYEKLNKRQRSGYDESLGITLTSTKSVSEFIDSADPVRMLTDVSKFVFTEKCELLKKHPKMTSDLIECFKDLRVLGKIDFKKMLKWRQIVRKERESLNRSEVHEVQFSIIYQYIVNHYLNIMEPYDRLKRLQWTMMM